MRTRPHVISARCTRGKRLICGLLLLFPLTFSNSLSDEVPDDGIGRTISRADKGAVEEFNRHDAHALAGRYWDDAIDISPAGIVSGNAAIEQRLVDLFKNSDPRDFDESIDKVEFSGEQGWIIGHWSYTALAADGTRHPAKGYIAAVLQGRHGVWKTRLHVITVAQ